MLIHIRLFQMSLCAAAIGLSALLAGTTGAAQVAPHPRLTFQSQFAGLAADRDHCLWEGMVDGAARGRITIALRQVEEPAAAANPVWHVASLWTVRDDSGGHSLAASLEGMVDWTAGTLRLGGWSPTAGWSARGWRSTVGS